MLSKDPKDLTEPAGLLEVLLSGKTNETIEAVVELMIVLKWVDAGNISAGMRLSA